VQEKMEKLFSLHNIKPGDLEEQVIPRESNLDVIDLEAE
jgi:hypothetical protein